MDILEKVYNALVADDYIKDKVFDRIKYYKYPETGDKNNPFIVIDPIDAPTPSDYADDKWTKYDCLFQVDVYTRNRDLTSIIADKIRDVMWDVFGFAQKSGPQEFDKDIYRDARRYRGTVYRDDFDSL